jgi:hypothetical protein
VPRGEPHRLDCLRLVSLSVGRDVASSRRAGCKDAPVPVSYNYIDGDGLARFILDVREEFMARPAHGDGDDTGRPNSVRLVAIDVFEDKPLDERLSVLADIISVNPGLILERHGSRDVFEYSDTAASYVTDIVCQIACQVLALDESIRGEDSRRLALAVESAKEQE